MGAPCDPGPEDPPPPPPPPPPDLYRVKLKIYSTSGIAEVQMILWEKCINDLYTVSKYSINKYD